MTSVLWWLTDAVLVLALLGLGGAALYRSRARQAVILFMAFGLVLALVWARLRAPDVALAEAAIGSGMAGSLLLAALRDPAPRGEVQRRPEASTRGLLGALLVALTVGLGWTVWQGIGQGVSGRLAAHVLANLEASGVGNPVTAVLLNFRSYDTLLELAVLLSALLGVLSLGGARHPYRPAGPVLASLVSWLVPLLVLAAGYQLWVGAEEPGGAFQAGALLAAAGVILNLAGWPGAALPGGLVLRTLAVSGIGVFLLEGVVTWGFGSGFLAYPDRWAGLLILLIESFATLAIAATLVLVYLGGEPVRWRTPLLGADDD